ncbi:MAG TPA: cupin domain-containing protein [Caulobacteraceae bacterium]|nr:cupin domain-containing protein [Caulobacteraceae bacterium]
MRGRTPFATCRVSEKATAVAPDGSEARPLLSLVGGSFAHFTLRPGAASKAVEHKTVEEIWFVVKGAGEIWRSQDGREEIAEIGPGACLTIPLGCAFQFRCAGPEPLAFVAITMPPWPGEGEAVARQGRWT